ncbi:MAG: hypothetical protein PVI30_18820 [Myxococcales bacterium]|jgi:hypothetical protein
MKTKHPLHLLPFMVILMLTAPACGDDDDDGDEDSGSEEGAAGGGGEGGEDGELELPEVDCDGADVPAFADVAAFQTCTTCHSSALNGEQRNQAPDDDNFNTYESAVEIADEAAHEVYEGAMPPADSGLSLTDAEKEELYLWALCGTPE